jgi:hypothetical protein
MPLNLALPILPCVFGICVLASSDYWLAALDKDSHCLPFSSQIVVDGSIKIAIGHCSFILFLGMVLRQPFSADDPHSAGMMLRDLRNLERSHTARGFVEWYPGHL